MITTQVTVWCDGLTEELRPPGRWHAEGCPFWIGQEDTTSQAKALARASGWHLPRDRRHYSPECWQAYHAARS